MVYHHDAAVPVSNVAANDILLSIEIEDAEIDKRVRDKGII